jgi:iron complex outermembrane receptor protein
LAIDHLINADWQAYLGLGTQRTVVHDRLAFPDGCSNATTYVYPGLCANGDVDLYDYRSENEERSTWAWDARLQGKLAAMGVQHRVRLSLSGRNAKTALNPTQAYNYVGSTNINTPAVLPGDGTALDLNTNSRERAVDASASLVSDLSSNVQSFVGFRTSQLNRSSERSDGSRAISFDQTVTTPWAGLSWLPTASTMLYASWGQGAELEAVPNRPTRFVNAGQVLPALKSEQTELGMKWQPNARVLVTAAAFNIDKPYADDQATASGIPCAWRVARRHGTAGWNSPQSARWMHPVVPAGQPDPAGRPVHRCGGPSTGGPVGDQCAQDQGSLFADYKIAALPGLSVSGLSDRREWQDGDRRWRRGPAAAWQLDAGLRYQNRLIGKLTQWSLHVENLTDRTTGAKHPRSIGAAPTCSRPHRAPCGHG